MNAINDLRLADTRSPGLRRLEEASESAPQPSVERTLRRTGRKPVRFEGWQLIEAAGSDGRCPIWYDLNLYSTVAGSVVVELVTRRHAVDDQDLFRVKTFADLRAAAAWLEGYRCAEDVPIPAGLSSIDTALPWAVLQAVQLRQRLHRIETDFHALLSEVFAALDLTDPAETDDAPVREAVEA